MIKYFAGIEKLEGGTYDVNSVVTAIQTFTEWAIKIGISLAGVSMVIGFILYAIADVEQKARVKQRIVQTVFGIIGIILAISIVNITIILFEG